MSESEVDDMFDFDSMTDGNIRFREARVKDLVFNIVRSDIIRHKEKTSHWTEFNKKLHKDELKHASVVGVQPLLNAKANDHNTINTCIERAKVITNKVGDDHVWFVADQDIYAPAQEPKWMRGDKDIYFRMGDSTPQISIWHALETILQAQRFQNCGSRQRFSQLEKQTKLSRAEIIRQVSEFTE